MALKSVHWTFYNEANPAEKIVVQDSHSAGVLAEVLKTHKDVWVVKEDYAQNTNPQIPAPVPASVPIASPSLQAAPPAQAVAHAHAAESAVPPPRRPLPKTEPQVDERRVQKRYHVDLRIILISKGRSFRSISQDVSLGGMKLKNKVPPEFSEAQCVAYISTSDAKENIEMVCQVISDPKDPRRVQFTDADSEQLKRLSRWLVENEVEKKAS